jgi:hypothetical protein
MRAVPVLVAAALLACPHLGAAAVPDAHPLVIANFDNQPQARFPAGWKTRGDQAEAERVYQVGRENNHQFLHAVAQGDSVQIGIPVAFRLSDYPLLSWRWRAQVLPAGADERHAATNDSAAGVYVVFKGGLGGLLPRAIKYVWSAREPCGSAFPSPRYSNARIVVLESGTKHAGRWRTETVNVAEDYRRLFQSTPLEPQGIAILTDADNTGSRAVADYADFRALPPASTVALTEENTRQAR